MSTVPRIVFSGLSVKDLYEMTASPPYDVKETVERDLIPALPRFADHQMLPVDGPWTEGRQCFYLAVVQCSGRMHEARQALVFGYAAQHPGEVRSYGWSGWSSGHEGAETRGDVELEHEGRSCTVSVRFTGANAEAGNVTCECGWFEG